MARYIDATERKRVCCNCGRNIRTQKRTYIECNCELDGHYIGYVECMTGWCRRWKKDRKWRESDGEIDAKKLEKDGWSASRTYPQDAHTMVYETKKMTDFPTADVVEVVRCKDCKYREGSVCDYSSVYVRPNGYCQWGERREDGDRLVMPPADGSTIKVDGERRDDVEETD